MAVVLEGRDKRNRPARKPDAIGNAMGYAKFRRRSHDAVIRVYDEAGSVIETHEHAGDFKSPSGLCYRWSHAALTRSTPMEL